MVSYMILLKTFGFYVLIEFIIVAISLILVSFNKEETSIKFYALMLHAFVLFILLYKFVSVFNL